MWNRFLNAARPYPSARIIAGGSALALISGGTPFGIRTVTSTLL